MIGDFFISLQITLNMSSVEAIQTKISKYISDLKPSAKGEMSLYSYRKDLRIQVSTAQTVQKATLTKFIQQTQELKPTVAMFISCVDIIPFNVSSTPCLSFMIHSKDLSKRFLEYLESLPDINEPEEEEDEEEEKELKPSKPAKVSKPAKEPKASPIDNYEATQEGFDKYCHEIVKSKIEFKKAQEKWNEQMKAYPKASDFINYIVSLKPPKETKKTKETKETKPAENE